jgi:hypothetical protein
MILIDGHRARTARGSSTPSMLPGIWMSVTIVKAPRPAHMLQGRRIGGASCFPAVSEHSG